MKIVPSTYTLTLDSGKHLELTADEHAELVTYYREVGSAVDSLPPFTVNADRKFEPLPELRSMGIVQPDPTTLTEVPSQ